MISHGKQILQFQFDLALNKISLQIYLQNKFGYLPKAKNEWLRWLTAAQNKLPRLRALGMTPAEAEAIRSMLRDLKNGEKET